MSRKHFALIANASPNASRTDIARVLASALAAIEPRFDTNKFLVACGVQSDA